MCLFWEEEGGGAVEFFERSNTTLKWYGDLMPKFDKGTGDTTVYNKLKCDAVKRDVSGRDFK